MIALRPNSSLRRAVLLTLAALVSLARPAGAVGPALERKGIGGLAAVPFSALSDQSISPLGHKALELRPAEWKHAETDNFVFHFVNSYVASPVAMEAQFYHRVVTKELGDAAPPKKCHIFLFEEPETWSSFKAHAHLDPWTGGIHAAGELFLFRDRSAKFKGDTLGHEITHLVLFRRFGAGLPLWVNEGYAEYASSIGYASYHRARGYDARPHSKGIASGDFIPLRRLTAVLAYPEHEKDVAAFYAESERLVRFLVAENKAAFLRLLQTLAGGTSLEAALPAAYGSAFPSIDALEKSFLPYATRDHAAP